jgi:prophage regulatory protein
VSKNLIRLRPLCERVGLSRARIYQLIQQGRFPAPVKIGDKASGWVDEEIEALIESRIAERDAELAAKQEAEAAAPKSPEPRKAVKRHGLNRPGAAYRT